MYLRSYNGQCSMAGVGFFIPWTESLEHKGQVGYTVEGGKGHG